MKIPTYLIRTLVATLALLAGLPSTHAQSTAFTYQGQLRDNGQPANGSYDLRFTLFDAASAGSAVAGPVTNSPVQASNGLFTVVLDFGNGVFTGADRWLGIGVRPDTGGAFATLSPRQRITATPYALYAPKAGAAVTAASATTASLVAAGGVGNAAVQSGAIDTGKILDGTIAEADLSSSLAEGTFWRLGGNAGTSAGPDFVGTTDDQPLELKVNNRRALRLEATGGNSVNMVGGYFRNSIDPGANGAVIAGGGGTFYGPFGGLVDGTNYIGADFSFIGGGYLNKIFTGAAAIGGGGNNAIETGAGGSVVGGGQANSIREGAYWSTVAGGNQNQLGSNSIAGAVGGGAYNAIQPDAPYATVDGGSHNTIQEGAAHAVIGGGELNVMGPNSDHSTISGGSGNVIETNTTLSTIGGGNANVIQSSVTNAVIAGGSQNLVAGGARSGVIGGGFANRVGANSSSATVGGGTRNISSGNYATVPGGRLNEAGVQALAAGTRAKALDVGSFVWADATDADFSSTSANQFLIRASGGVGIGTNSPVSALQVAGTVTAEAFDGPVAASQLSGTLASAQLAGTYSSALTLNNAGNSFSGTFSGTHSGSGSGLTGLNASQLTSGTVPDARLSGSVARTRDVWLLGGNAETQPGTHFLGTRDKQPLELKVNGMRALRFEDNGDSKSDAGTIPDGAPNVIGGSPANTVGEGIVGATIGGGGASDFNGASNPQAVLADYATVGGGLGNRVAEGSYFGTIAGGYVNDLGTNSYYGAIGGGNRNRIGDNSPYSTIAGGNVNDVGDTSGYSAIGGGRNNNVWEGSAYAMIGGGYNNDIGANSDYSAVGGGNNNDVADGSQYVTLAGGYRNSVGTNSFWCAIGGGSDNQVVGKAQHAAIAGGNSNQVGVLSHYGSIGGGRYNRIADGSWSATIGGGFLNTIGSNSYSTTVGGGTNNTIGNDSHACLIAGGFRNGIGADAAYSTIGGGIINSIADQSEFATIAGGHGIRVGANCSYSAVGGGHNHDVGANSEYVTIAGGNDNDIDADSSGSTIGGGLLNAVGANSEWATIGGGYANEITRNASYATIAGGQFNFATNRAFAAGTRAKARHTGTFVWADSLESNFSSTGNNQFLIRAAGGMGIGTASPAFALHVNGSAGKPGGGSWSVASDERLKKNIHPLKGALDQLLHLRGVSFEYKHPEAVHELPGERMGMIAQEVETVFPDWVETGNDGLKRLTVRGFEALTVEAIRQLREEKDARIATLEARLERLEELLNSVAKSGDAGAL